MTVGRRKVSRREKAQGRSGSSGTGNRAERQRIHRWRKALKASFTEALTERDGGKPKLQEVAGMAVVHIHSQEGTWMQSERQEGNGCGDTVRLSMRGNLRRV
jgi:hypothetical protein